MAKIIWIAFLLSLHIINSYSKSCPQDLKWECQEIYLENKMPAKGDTCVDKRECFANSYHIKTQVKTAEKTVVLGKRITDLVNKLKEKFGSKVNSKLTWVTPPSDQGDMDALKAAMEGIYVFNCNNFHLQYLETYPRAQDSAKNKEKFYRMRSKVNWSLLLEQQLEMDVVDKPLVWCAAVSGCLSGTQQGLTPFGKLQHAYFTRYVCQFFKFK